MKLNKSVANIQMNKLLLSKRTLNALDKIGIHTVEQLVNLDLDKCVGNCGLGEKAHSEIENVINSLLMVDYDIDATKMAAEEVATHMIVLETVKDLVGCEYCVHRDKCNDMHIHFYDNGNFCCLDNEPARSETMIERLQNKIKNIEKKLEEYKNEH